MNILVRMPTRGRPEQAMEVLEKYHSMAGIPIKIEVVVDNDDVTMTDSVINRMALLFKCTVTRGHHNGKVAACNGGYISDWDVLLLASDDMVPVAEGYASKVSDAMRKYFPSLNGAIYFNDGYQGKNICTLPIMGRKIYDQFGYVYAPQYTSLFCDNEQTDLLGALGRLVYVDEKIIEHRHPVVTGKTDALYARNDAFFLKDRQTYFNRKSVIAEYARARLALEATT